MVITTRIQN